MTKSSIQKRLKSILLEIRGLLFRKPNFFIGNYFISFSQDQEVFFLWGDYFALTEFFIVAIEGKKIESNLHISLYSQFRKISTYCLAPKLCFEARLSWHSNPQNTQWYFVVYVDVYFECIH